MEIKHFNCILHCIIGWNIKILIMGKPVDESSKFFHKPIKCDVCPYFGVCFGNLKCTETTKNGCGHNYMLWYDKLEL